MQTSNKIILWYSDSLPEWIIGSIAVYTVYVEAAGGTVEAADCLANKLKVFDDPFK